ncbi:MAG TPA: hypothetical protein VF916_02265 [Ktedonobacterales bacterium]
MATSADGQFEKPKILGQPHALPEDEANSVNAMIREVQQSDRQLTIPPQDLAQGATTQMAPEVARIIDESKVLDILRRFNRDFLYGQGRFDEYDRGLLLKWGDGYSRKHIWLTVEGDNLVFETSHERRCDKPYCAGGHHVFTPAVWRDVGNIHAELAEQFKRPVYERSDD